MNKIILRCTAPNEQVYISKDRCALLVNNIDEISTGYGAYGWQHGAALYRSLLSEARRDVTISAIQTTTRTSLSHPTDIVDEYIRHGMYQLYIRPLTPLGYAASRWDQIDYTPEEYLKFYKAVIDYMLTLNRAGTFVSEATASVYLARMLNNESVSHMEHRSPCGGAVGQMAVNFDGSIYTYDEARMLANMGDNSFYLGNVTNSYFELITSPAAHAVCTASCIESLPFCSECVYSPYCAVCPVVNYSLEGDLISHKKENYHCKIAKGIIEYLFSIIKRADPNDMETFHKWAGN